MRARLKDPFRLVEELGVVQGNSTVTADTNVRVDGPYWAGNGSSISNSVTYPEYQENLVKCLAKTLVTLRADDNPHKFHRVQWSLAKIRMRFVEASKRGKRVIFIGNGGSAAIASHMAIDYTKNGRIRSIAFNDAPTLSCLANDFGYENVFAKQIEYQAAKGDVVVIISSSGKSANILAAAQAAFKRDCFVVTFTGMNPNNKLRRLGDVNFYVPALEYGLVEVTHLMLLHAVVSVVRWT